MVLYELGKSFLACGMVYKGLEDIFLEFCNILLPVEKKIDNQSI